MSLACFIEEKEEGPRCPFLEKHSVRISKAHRKLEVQSKDNRKVTMLVCRISRGKCRNFLTFPIFFSTIGLILLSLET